MQIDREKLGERIGNTMLDVHKVREQAALDIANEVIWFVTGIRDHPYEKQAGEIAEALESVL